MSELIERYRAAQGKCTSTVVGRLPRTPEQHFTALAEACARLGIDTADRYGEGGPVQRLEAEVAELLGSEMGVFFPSGTMAQQAALRVWCERRGSLRVALPGLAHQLQHEEDGPRLLQDFRFELLGTGRNLPTADDLRGLPDAGRLGAVQLELPLREAGCLLPTWDELTEFVGAAQELGVPLHVDGARIWECQPHFERPLAEVVAGFDSVYVSFYKGLASPAGAMVLGAADLAGPLRVWRKRMGGTLFRMTENAVGALIGLREELPQVPRWVTWAQAFAGELAQRGLRVQPDPPQTNAFLLYAEAAADEVTERTIAFMTDRGIVPGPPWQPAEMPGTAATEITVTTPALDHDPATVADWFRELID